MIVTTSEVPIVPSLFASPHMVTFKPLVTFTALASILGAILAQERSIEMVNTVDIPFLIVFIIRFFNIRIPPSEVLYIFNVR